MNIQEAIDAVKKNKVVYWIDDEKIRWGRSNLLSVDEDKDVLNLGGPMRHYIRLKIQDVYATEQQAEEMLWRRSLGQKLLDPWCAESRK
jgi:hypothetical protein